MALGIVKIYLGSPFSANRRCSRSVVVDPTKVNLSQLIVFWLSHATMLLCMLVTSQISLLGFNIDDVSYHDK